jgi:GTP cyclohydrolase I
MHHTNNMIDLPGQDEHRLMPNGDDREYVQGVIRDCLSTIIRQLGYDLQDQHFKRTPERAAKVLMEFAKNASPEKVAGLLEVSFDDAYDSLVQVGPITVKSMCAHHMLPVYGNAWVGYLPNERVCGLSKLARITHHFAKQYTLQERVTDQIADALETHLQPKGAMVVIDAVHGCMSHRGVEEPNAGTMTSSVRGVFREEADARHEFLALMRRP